MLTPKQLYALRLRRLGMTDGEVAGLLGLKHRESANRLINAAKRRLAEVVAFGPAEVREALAAGLDACAPGPPCGTASSTSTQACGGCTGRVTTGWSQTAGHALKTA